MVFFDPDYPENPTEEQDANFKEKQLIPNIFSDYESSIISVPIQVDSDVKTVSSRAEGHQKLHFWP